CKTQKPPLPDLVRGVDPHGHKLSFEAGAFTFLNQRVLLCGKPLQVLEALANGRSNTKTLAALRDEVWGDAEIGEETIRSAVTAARSALRTAMKNADVNRPVNPIPIADRGTGRTAWRLDLP